MYGRGICCSELRNWTHIEFKVNSPSVNFEKMFPVLLGEGGDNVPRVMGGGGAAIIS